MALIGAPVIATYKTLGFGGWVAVLVPLGVLAWAIVRSKTETMQLK